MALLAFEVSTRRLEQGSQQLKPEAALHRSRRPALGSSQETRQADSWRGGRWEMLVQQGTARGAEFSAEYEIHQSIPPGPPGGGGGGGGGKEKLGRARWSTQAMQSLYYRTSNE